MRRTAGYTLSNHRRNEEIMKELHTPQITEFIEKYRINWKDNAGNMSADGIPRKILKYQQKGKSKFRMISETMDSVM
jgi:hypothetical protein